MNRLISRAFLWTVLLGAFWPLVGAPVDVGPLRQIVTEKLALVAAWESAARVQMFLMVTGIACGGLVTILQRVETKTWCKVTAALLGVATMVVTGVMSQTPVSKAAYEKAILQATAKISALNDAINLLLLNPEPDGQKALRDEFTKTVKEINQIQMKLSGDEKSLALSWGPTSVVYAQSKTPAWVTTLPASSSDWYFRGQAESRSLSEAQTNSLKDAIERATQQLLSQGKSVPIEAAREYAKKSTAVADTAFTYDSKAQTYRYYTLLRLDKSLARPEVVASLSVPAAPISAVPPKDPSPGCSTAQVGQDELATLRVKLKPIYIYLAGQSQTRPKFGVLKMPPDKADMIVFTNAAALSGLLELASALRQGSGPAPDRMKIKNSLFRSMLKTMDPNAYIENKLENGRAFEATIDGEKYTIQVETHFVRRFAILTVCPA